MISSFILMPLIAVFWIAGSLAVLFPVFGMAWIVAHLTDLTLAEACFIAFFQFAILVYLLQTYFARRGLGNWYSALIISATSLTITTLEGLLLRNLTDLTLFQAVLIASGAGMLVAYMVSHSMMGSVPTFLRDIFFQDMMDDALGDIELDMPPSPPPPRPRRRKRK
jgi:hypothetical protein